ncbi:murein biosynthesis integral membrane protein MurJ [Microvirga lenta]|uniref:murein biosynthesis integral membrane protein MurJ n=1 Tax=Microvirga lenta TaxID=2881337 RepID=UPI001CFFC4AA|nr:murein biosynthesis integral membrane protein MurJ [Microvirga lenta]MCB5174798.1 murein biosynthesis integral membrane protein MurJ [Microvirga lenta]
MSLIRSSLLVGLGSVASRILGFGRDILFAQVLGAGPVADAFLAAFRLPNLVRRIVGEGGLNPALVPALSRLEPGEAARVAGDVVSVFALGLLALSGLVEIGAGLLAFVLAPGLVDDGGTLALVALYTRLGFPMVLGVTLSSVAAALLNLRGRYGAAAFAPLIVNGGLIAVAVALEAGSTLPLPEKAAWLAAAASLAGLLQLAAMAAALPWGEGRMIAFRVPRPSPLVKSLLLAGFPALVASGAVQLFVLVGTQIASFWPSGVSWLYYADRVMQLPLGLMAAFAASVLLPQLALKHRAGEDEAVVAAQNRALELALFLALPAAAALVVLAWPIASVLFARGAFTQADAAGTARVLACLSLGLPFATVAKVLSQTLFARNHLRATLVAALIGIAVTAAASLLLAPAFGVAGIALGISLGCFAQAGVLVGSLRRLGLWSPDAALAGRAVRIACASTVMGLGLAAAAALVPRADAVVLAALCLGGLVLYGAAARLTGALTRDDIALLAKKA